MPTAKLTIASLMATVVLAALAFVGLRESNLLWASITFTCVLTTLLAATLTSLLARGMRRAIAAGFALFGWAALALAMGPLSLHHRDAPGLAAWPLSEILRGALHPNQQPANIGATWQNSAQPPVNWNDMFVPAGGGIVPLAPPAPVWSAQTADAFEQTLLSLQAMLLATLGAIWGALEYRRRQATTPPPA